MGSQQLQPEFFLTFTFVSLGCKVKDVKAACSSPGAQAVSDGSWLRRSEVLQDGSSCNFSLATLVVSRFCMVILVLSVLSRPNFI